jgi:hypothetical protein
MHPVGVATQVDSAAAVASNAYTPEEQAIG